MAKLNCRVWLKFTYGLDTAAHDNEGTDWKTKTNTPAEKKDGKGVWGETWNSISENLSNADGFILVVPEYGGMATPAAKNIFLLSGNGEFAHKPGLIVSISSGNGGAYPIAELRSSSYKNTHIMWIPENIIIRNVEEFNPEHSIKIFSFTRIT